MAQRRTQNARRNTGTGTEPGTTTEPGTGIDLAGFESFEATYTDDGTGTGTETSTEAEPGTGTEPGTQTTSTGKKRGRKPGSTNKQAESIQDIDSLSTLLLSIHSMGAMLLKSPELEIDESDAKKIAASIERVRAHYPTNFNPKAMAWLNLGTTLAGVYGIQFMAVRNRIKRNNQKKVVEMPKPAAQPPVQQSQPRAAASTLTVPSQFNPAPPVGDFD